MDYFKVDFAENIGVDWPIASIGYETKDGKEYIVATNQIRGSELHKVSGGAKFDAELIVQLLNQYYTEKKVQIL